MASKAIVVMWPQSNRCHASDICVFVRGTALVVLYAREPVGLEGLMKNYKYPEEQEMGATVSVTPAL